MTQQAIDIITLFPELFEGFLNSSLIAKAIQKKILDIRTTQLRSFAPPPHFHVDDSPYGGGAGMVLKPEPLYAAIQASRARLRNAPVILLSAQGRSLSSEYAREIAALDEVIYVCGRYEGVDQRVIDLAIDQELSIGDYVLMGGEVAAMVTIEASSRFIPGVIGNSESLAHESFETVAHERLLEAPHYTRPAEFLGRAVPAELLSGDHARIATWRQRSARERTEKKRPDLFETPKPQQIKD